MSKQRMKRMSATTEAGSFADRRHAPAPRQGRVTYSRVAVKRTNDGAPSGARVPRALWGPRTSDGAAAGCVLNDPAQPRPTRDQRVLILAHAPFTRPCSSASFPDSGLSC
jgi:hypothetical protein